MWLSLVSSIPAVREGGCCPWKSLPPSHLLFLLCLGHRSDGRAVGRTLERRRRLSGAGCGTCREAAGIKRGPRAAGAWGEGVLMGPERLTAVFIPGITRANFPPAILSLLGLPLSAPQLPSFQPPWGWFTSLGVSPHPLSTWETPKWGLNAPSINTAGLGEFSH